MADSPKKSRTKTIMIVLAIVVLLVLVYYTLYPRLDMRKVKESIAEFSSTAENPSEAASLEFILLQGVKEIRWNMRSFRAVKKFAETTGISVETAIVDAAIDQARSYGYIV